MRNASTAPTTEAPEPPVETAQETIARLKAENARLEAALPLGTVIRPTGWHVEMEVSRNEIDENGRSFPKVERITSLDDPYLIEMGKHGWPGYITVFLDGKPQRAMHATVQQFREFHAMMVRGEEPKL